MMMVPMMANLEPVQQRRDDEAGEGREVSDERDRDRQQLRVGQIEFQKIQQ